VQKNQVSKCLYLVDFRDDDFFIKVVRPFSKGLKYVSFDIISTIRESSQILPGYIFKNKVKLDDIHIYEDYEEAEKWLEEKIKTSIGVHQNKIQYLETLKPEMKQIKKKMKNN